MPRSLLPLLLACLFLSSPAAAQNGSVQVLSATVKDQKIAGANVILQKDGTRSVSVDTDAQGRAGIDAARASDPGTLIIIKKPGYSNLVAKCPCDGLTYALSPVMDSLDGIRVVLSWGADPLDLDSHLVFPGNHVYFGKKSGDGANLDVDDTDSYGPETITLQRSGNGIAYEYAVHDFSNLDRPASEELSDSSATVFVYVGESLVRTYYVPRGIAGNLWSVFRITGNGEFQDINQIRGIRSNAAGIDGVVSSGRSGAPVAAVVSQGNLSQARSLNRAGEQAYAAGNLEEALRLYRQAIDLHPEFGQAYSNLGLAYLKLGRAAEAIWASRKAIALADGQYANVTRANSHYNIGMLYEKAGQYEQALDSYQAAQRERPKPAYEEAIRRMLSR
ncbi:tetratricopeptide repeat protein [Pseudoxanthomonas putridarboris]|uniref:Tetratricopeptide repeat protein n=1 Tax=Pseudoxanthomonas putridarboris TaxID=752605 RepID=A0ABU9IZK6_9GAMM